MSIESFVSELDDLIQKDFSKYQNILLLANTLDNIGSFLQQTNIKLKIIEILSDFSNNLRDLKPNEIKVDSIEYIIYTIQDIKNFLKEYLIEKKYGNEYIIQDSMIKNIEFLFSNLRNEDGDSGSLEFF